MILKTAMLSMLMKTVGPKNTIMIGLLFEMLNLMWYGFGSQTWFVIEFNNYSHLSITTCLLG